MLFLNIWSDIIRKMKKIIKILLTAAWMMIIFLFSNQPGAESSVTSNGVGIWLYSVISYIFNDIGSQSEFLIKYIPLIRKLAHFGEFAVLGVLVKTLSDEYSFSNKTLYSVLIDVTYACFDEFHQLFVVNRVASIKDVLIDSFGVIAGVAACHLIYKKWLK